MTVPTVEPRDSTAQRGERVVAAALRAAYAWSIRHEDKRYRGAMRELAQMTAVVVEAHGAGRGPSTPLDLVPFLRRPLAQLLAPVGSDDAVDDPAVAEVTLLDDHDRLTDAAYDVVCEYAALPLSRDSVGWLPSWTWMQAEQVEREVFEALTVLRDDGAYVRARRFLVEHPAGAGADLSNAAVASGARLVAQYEAVPAGQRYASRGRQWWWA